MLWGIAPHIIWPLRFVLPESKDSRPAWLLRLGLFLYDHIGGRKRLPPTRALDLRTDIAGAVLKPEMTKGFEYSDCWVMDARLVALNARDAAARGAQILTHTEVTSLTRRDGGFVVSLKEVSSGPAREIGARLVVNAAGPWVDHVLNRVADEQPRHHVRLVQGSAISWCGELYKHDRCYIFQNRDGRVIFAIPYENDFTLIGTTDRDYSGDPCFGDDQRRGKGLSPAAAATASIFVPRSRAIRSSGAIPACGPCSTMALQKRRKPPANMC